MIKGLWRILCMVLLERMSQVYRGFHARTQFACSGALETLHVAGGEQRSRLEVRDT